MSSRKSESKMESPHVWNGDKKLFMIFKTLVSITLNAKGASIDEIGAPINRRPGLEVRKELTEFMLASDEHDVREPNAIQRMKDWLLVTNYHKEEELYRRLVEERKAKIFTFLSVVNDSLTSNVKIDIKTALATSDPTTIWNALATAGAHNQATTLADGLSAFLQPNFVAPMTIAELVSGMETASQLLQELGEPEPSPNVVCAILRKTVLDTHRDLFLTTTNTLAGGKEDGTPHGKDKHKSLLEIVEQGCPNGSVWQCPSTSKPKDSIRKSDPRGFAAMTDEEIDNMSIADQLKAYRDAAADAHEYEDPSGFAANNNCLLCGKPGHHVRECPEGSACNNCGYMNKKGRSYQCKRPGGCKKPPPRGDRGRGRGNSNQDAIASLTKFVKDQAKDSKKTKAVLGKLTKRLAAYDDDGESDED